MRKNQTTLPPALAAQLPTLEGVAKLFYPYVEVTLHDLESGKIVALYNNFSKRAVGDRSAISKFVGDHVGDFPDVFEPYYKVNWDGRRLKCISITVRDDSGKAVGLSCFDFDVSVFKDINTRMAQLLSVDAKEALSPIEQFTDDWQQRVNECISNYLKENSTTLAVLTKDQKRAAVNRLYDHGLFNYRKAAAYVAVQLHISRATVYNYLKEV